MKKFRNITLGGIQQKIFNLVLITFLLMMGTFSAVMIYLYGQTTSLVHETNNLQKQSITSISQETMDAVLKANMTQGALLQAYIATDYFEDAAGAVRMIADYAGHLFANPGAYSAREVSRPDREKDGQISAQVLTEEGVDPDGETIREKLGLIGNLADLMTALYAEANVDSCYIALPEGVMLLVDDHAASKFDENGRLISIPIRDRLWYQNAVENGKLGFTDVTRDLFTGKVSLMCSMPVYQDGKLAAVIGADLFLDDVAAAVDSLSRDGGIVCIVNEKGHVIFSPVTEGLFQVKQQEEAKDLRAAGDENLAAFIRDALQDNTDLRTFEADGETYYATGAPIQNVGWTILSVVPKTVADQPTLALTGQYDAIQARATETFREKTDRMNTMIIVLLSVVMVLTFSGAVVLPKHIVKPLDTITKKVLTLDSENLQFRMSDDLRTGDEIEVLAESFAMLSQKTVEYIGQVERVTAEKERIGTELALATRIQADMLPNIYPAFPERNDFDIYASMDPAKEVGGDFYDYFLVDDDHLCFTIADVSGKGVPAALFMMASRIILANQAQMGKSPAQILTDTNAAICSNNREEMFVTVWLGILNLRTGKLVAANAGHEYPVLKKPEGYFEMVKDKHGFVIGGMDGVRYKEYELQIEPGAKLFVYTDGVAEATNAEKELFGTDRMIEALNRNPSVPPKEILQNVQAAVDEFVKDAEQFDDLTMLCLEYKGSRDSGPRSA